MYTEGYFLSYHLLLYWSREQSSSDGRWDFPDEFLKLSWDDPQWGSGMRRACSVIPVLHFHHLWIKSSKLLSWDLQRTTNKQKNKLILDIKADRGDDSNVIYTGSSHQPFLLPSSLLGLVREDRGKNGDRAVLLYTPITAWVWVCVWFEYVCSLLQPEMTPKYHRSCFPVVTNKMSAWILIRGSVSVLNEERCLCTALESQGGQGGETRVPLWFRRFRQQKQFGSFEGKIVVSVKRQNMLFLVL